MPWHETPTTFQLCNDNGTPEDFHSRNVTYYHRSSLIHELTAVTNMTIGRCKVWKSNYSCWYQSTPSTTVGGILFQAGLLSGKRTRKRTAIFTVSSEFEWTKSTIFSSVRSSYSHPDLLLTHHQHPTFSDHIGPQQWTFTFWATTAIPKAITGLICWLHVYLICSTGHHCKIVQCSAR